MGRRTLGTDRVRRAVVAAVVFALGATGLLRAQVAPGGRWLTLETAHFRIHVRPPLESLGVRTAGEAERAYAALAAHLPAPRGAIDLVVTDNADYAHAYATIYPSPRVVVYPYPPIANVELQRYDRWLGLVITHELAHVFHLDLAGSWWRLGRAVFGRMPVFFPNLFLPTWLIEGTAVHYESALTGAGRDAGTYHAAVVAAQAAEAGGLPIDAAGATSPRWPGGYRPYAFGGAFLHHLAATRGDSVVDRLALATARVPFAYLFLNGALRRSAGISFTWAWTAWQQEERARSGAAAPVAAESSAAVAGLRTPVPPRVSADGRRILFVRADGRDEARIAVLDREGGTVRTLARVDGGLGVAWDTGGGVVAAEWDYTDPYTVRADLRRVDADGRERRLTRGARLVSPDVGPDGAVVAVHVEGGLSTLVRRRGDTLEALTSAAPGVEWAHPRFAPGGQLVAATRAVDGALDVVLLDALGAVVRAVTRDGAVDQMPAFSADGAWLFWASDRTGRSQVYATRVADDGPWWRVSDEPFGAYGPAPAADSLFYLAYHADGYRLTAVPFDTVRWTPVARPSDDVPIVPTHSPSAAIVARGAYRPWRSLAPKFWFPVGVGQAPASWIGAFTSGQDALERHAYSATLMLGTDSAAGTWQGEFSYQYAGLPPAVLDASFSRTEDAFASDSAPGGAVVRCCLGSEEGAVGVGLTHRRFRWSAAMRLGAEFGRFEHADGGWRGVVASASASRVVAPAFAISAQKGWRVSATLRRRWWDDGSGAYHEASARGALYVPGAVAGFARQVLALRVSAGALWGARAPAFAVGGVSGGTVPLVPGVAVGSGQRAFPVRGFAAGDAIGQRVVAASLEARSPLALVGRGVGLVPASLDRLSLAFFADAALAWMPQHVTFGPGPGGSDPTTVPSGATLLASVGGELVADLGVVYDFPVRLRLGAAVRAAGASGAGLFAAAGAAF